MRRRLATNDEKRMSFKRNDKARRGRSFQSDCGHSRPAVRALSVLIESEPGSNLLFDAFSSREPVSTSLENALAAGVKIRIFPAHARRVASTEAKILYVPALLIGQKTCTD